MTPSQESAKPGGKPGTLKLYPRGEINRMKPQVDYPNYAWGQRIRLESDAGAGWQVHEAIWDFGEPMLKGQLQTQPKGKRIWYPSTVINAKIVDIYVPRPGPGLFWIEARITFKRNNETMVRDMTSIFGTSLPTAVITTNATSGINFRNNGAGQPMIQFGNASVPGISMNVRITLPDGRPGDVSAIQFMRGSRVFTKTNGSIVTIGTNDQWFLDKTRDLEITYGSNTTKRLYVGQTGVVVSVSDRPAVGLRDDIFAVMVNETFRTYFVYKPDPWPEMAGLPVFWVPLGYIEWSWKVDLARTTKSSPWPKTFNHPPAFRDASLLQFTPASELPEWNGYTKMLLDQTRAEIGEFPGEWDPISFQPPTEEARQMVVRLNRNVNDVMRNTIESITGVKTSSTDPTPQSFAMWCTPAAANKTKGLPGVYMVEEFPQSARYNPPANRKQGKDWLFLIAPYIMYDRDDADRIYGAMISPTTVYDVALKLIDMARQRGMPGVTIKSKTYKLVKLTFPTPPNDDMIRFLASHYQVNHVEMESGFRPDDPVFPDK